MPVFLRANLVIVQLLVLTPLVFSSPLPRIYHYPNNFTNQSAFQYEYHKIDWSKSRERTLVPGYTINNEQIPAIYNNRQLISSAIGIIEYPMLIGDHFNNLYYYQHVHDKFVVAGFTKEDIAPPDPQDRGFVKADRTVDHVMTALKLNNPSAKTSWQSMVDITDDNQLRSYSGWLLIVHKKPEREATLNSQQQVKEFYDELAPNILYLKITLTRNFGTAIHEDKDTMAWLIP